MDFLNHHYSFQVKLLLSLIAVFSVAFIVFFILTFLKRFKRIKKNELKANYQNQIDTLLFELLFNQNVSVNKIALKFKNEIVPTKLIKKITLKSINALHRNYTGDLKKRIELFYIESELVNYSLEKLNSLNWAKVIEGIRDISNLKYQPAYEIILSKLKHSKTIVQKEAFIGVILLKGLDELIKNKDNQLYLDDWTQSNILYVIKRDQMTLPDNIEELFKSKNKTIILLGARILHYFQANHYLHLIENYLIQNPNSTIKPKLDSIINQLKNIHQ
ncbi:hypothetical protein [Flavobacterium terrae]|uniref:HEAT repeat-containing protein n=1 Tax=Flavobacterium terrae TaxID=415425 RepID=A0A1M6GWS1_9FLAO|nr:hypothetical protein [Flavobacterium terrae]SHJ14408.1 hypothetical protein SAMN05444363_2773 [Flavobacterium terrae]